MIKIKIPQLKPIKLKDYGFGLFLYNDQLCLKTEDGECYYCSSGEALESKDNEIINNSVITPLEY